MSKEIRTDKAQVENTRNIPSASLTSFKELLR